ncbi:unnamed protein product [Cunninghamella blakesleeana]
MYTNDETIFEIANIVGNLSSSLLLDLFFTFLHNHVFICSAKEERLCQYYRKQKHISYFNAFFYSSTLYYFILLAFEEYKKLIEESTDIGDDTPSVSSAFNSKTSTTVTKVQRQ